jgi:hypothetical protein
VGRTDGEGEAVPVRIRRGADDVPERMRYLGVLALLCECSVYVPEELRESVERALIDACADGTLKYRRVLNRFEIEPNRDG